MIDLVEKILSDLYRIKIPLPNNPLGFLNSYVVKGDGGSLIIDTGMNRRECLKPMLGRLKDPDVDLDETDLFLTHLHADHLGLVGELASGNSKVYLNDTEASYLSSEDVNFPHSSFFRSHGFPGDELKTIVERHPRSRYSLNQNVDFSVLREDDRIEI